MEKRDGLKFPDTPHYYAPTLPFPSLLAHQHLPLPTAETATTKKEDSFCCMASDAGPAPLRQHSSKKLHRKQSYSRRGKSSSSMSSCTVLLHFVRYVLLLLPPALYLSGVITCVGPILQWGPPPPGSVYRTHLLFDQLWPHILADHSPAIQLGSMWRLKRKQHKHTVSCPNITTSVHKTTDIPGEATTAMYLMVDANGGLNQQRSSICSAVAVAGLLGATLVIPRFEFHNLWRDSSQFADIYDEDYFIYALKDLVTVVRELPEELMKAYDYNITNIPTFRVEAWAPHTFYLNEVYPVLNDQRVIRISPFANRLSMNVPPDIQLLRCHANYKALRFSSSISTLAQKLVNRMTEKSSTSGGRYVSVHLRFEEDMVAFSCCLYDGGWSEKYYMDTIRTKGWGQKFKKRDRVDAPGLNRINGKCPMTPLEVGLMLRGMGLANDTPIYLASGKIYRAEKSLEPLRKMFPLLETKETLATADELAVFQGFSSRLAALDYSVCLYSEVFVSTQGGNFPHFLMGHRRFLYNGHAKTIKPDKRSLVLLLHNSSIRWDAFKNEMQSMLAASVRTGGAASRTKRKSKRKDSVYLNPLPDCQCLWESKNLSSGLAL